MAIAIQELKRWLNTLPKDGSVAIDEGGLTMTCLEDEDAYIEVGGDSEDLEDGDSEDWSTHRPGGHLKASVLNLGISFSHAHVPVENIGVLKKACEVGKSTFFEGGPEELP